jgi:hypothetical protein
MSGSQMVLAKNAVAVGDSVALDTGSRAGRLAFPEGEKLVTATITITTAPPTDITFAAEMVGRDDLHLTGLVTHGDGGREVRPGKQIHRSTSHPIAIQKHATKP